MSNGKEIRILVWCRFEVLLSLVLAVGGLLPASEAEPLPQIAPLDPSQRQAIAVPLQIPKEERAPSPAALADEWGNGGGFQDADSASDGWADDNFQAAEEAPVDADAADAELNQDVKAADGGDSDGGWGADFEAATPREPVDQLSSAPEAGVEGEELSETPAAIVDLAESNQQSGSGEHD